MKLDFVSVIKLKRDFGGLKFLGCYFHMYIYSRMLWDVMILFEQESRNQLWEAVAILYLG